MTFISFLIIKNSYYDAITPDYFGLCLSFISLYLIERKFFKILVFIMIIANFVNPIINIISFLLILFKINY